MKINGNILVAECTAYDYKEALERKKTKSWLKSIVAFANTEGGSLYYGIANDGTIKGLDDIQADADFISETIKAKVDPIPDIEIVPFSHEGKQILEVKVKKGMLTPYYYVHDGARTAFTRIGNESVECDAQQLMTLMLRGSGRTWDSLKTTTPADKYSFRILANTFEERTHQQWEDKLLVSFGLVTNDGYLTNAGSLFTDNCGVFNSRLFCTRWSGLFKDNAFDSKEYQGNIILLLRQGLDFMKNFTMQGWVIMPTHRLNVPDYAERALTEALVNSLIHRSYIPMGSEVHIDIFDDRIEIHSPGGMYDGTFIQDQDIADVSSNRRNPVLAEVFAQLGYMEKRGSGLRRMREITSKLPRYTADKAPQYKSSASQFITTLYNVNWQDGQRVDMGTNVPKNVENVPRNTENVPRNPKNVPRNPKNVPRNTENVPENVPRNFPQQVETDKAKPITKTAQAILDAIVNDPQISRESLAQLVGISEEAAKKQLQRLKERGIIDHEGPTKGGYWKVIV